MLIHRGVYRELVLIRRSGTANKPIVFQGESGARIDGTGISLPHYAGLITIDEQRYVTVKGLMITNSSFYGIHVAGSAHVHIEHNQIERTAHGGVIIDDGSQHIEVLHNQISHTNNLGAQRAIHEALTISNAHDFEIAYNHVHDCLEEGIDAKDGTTNGSIHHNRIERTGAVSLYLCHARFLRVYRNRIQGGESTGLQISVGDMAEGSAATSDNDVYQNVISDQQVNGLEFWRDREGARKRGTMARNRLYNNVLVRNGQSGIRIDYAKKTAIHNNIVAFNTGAGITGNAIADSEVSHNLFYRNGEGSNPGLHNVLAPPGFADLEHGDFRLMGSSAAIDSGMSVGLPYAGKAPDIGAYEFKQP